MVNAAMAYDTYSKEHDGRPPLTQMGAERTENRESRPTDPDSAVRRFHSVKTPGNLEPMTDPYDRKLQNIDISYWTEVPIANDLAARVIKLYLSTDHPLLGVFDPDLFITDLIKNREVYCSRFLVHAVMYLGCVSISHGNEITASLHRTNL